MKELADMYRLGQGVDRDLVTAHLLFDLSASNGVDQAKKMRDIVAADMTRTEIAEAEKMAAEWRKEHQ